MVRQSGSLFSYILLLYRYMSSAVDSLVATVLQEVTELECMKLFLDYLSEVGSKTCSGFTFEQPNHPVDLVLPQDHTLQFDSS